MAEKKGEDFENHQADHEAYDHGHDDEYEVFFLTDEKGDEKAFGFVAEIEDAGNVYWVCEELEIHEDGSATELGELYLFKKTEENGELYLSSIDDDEEFERVAKIWEDFVESEEG